jgi:hypothetical protein
LLHITSRPVSCRARGWCDTGSQRHSRHHRVP